MTSSTGVVMGGRTHKLFSHGKIYIDCCLLLLVMFRERYRSTVRQVVECTNCM